MLILRIYISNVSIYQPLLTRRAVSQHGPAVAARKTPARFIFISHHHLCQHFHCQKFHFWSIHNAHTSTATALFFSCPSLLAPAYSSISPEQGPASTRYSTRTRNFLSYSNSTRTKHYSDRVVSSINSRNFRIFSTIQV